MNCAEARDIILSADHNALRERTDPVLREHLAGCAKCAAEASHVVADVDRLRAALIARGARAVPAARARRSSTKRVAMTLVPIALAAELAAFAFLGSKDRYNPITDRPIIDDSVVSVLPVVHTTIDTAAVTSSPAPKTVSKRKVKKDTTKDRPQVLASEAPIDFAPRLQVIPRARQRYAVIGTSDPKVTVVWLTKGDTL